ncbi:MAG: beta-propeller domain-containing protein, partial [Candidatus Bathyarchaeota archaeon]
MLYGVLAVLLGTFVTAFAFRFGVYDLGTEILPPSSTPPSTLFTTFNSYGALKDFLTLNSGTPAPFPFYGPEDVRALSRAVLDFESQPSSEWGLDDFSTTNIQVAGVDEADIVKTDGEYLYVLTGGSLLIIKAYPPE